MMKFKFTGTGGELFGKLIVGLLLTLITFGIYTPWFMIGMQKYLYEKTTFGPTAKGDLKLQFTGEGSAFFVLLLVGYLLTMITIGIYTPWFIAKLLRFYADNSSATASDGTSYQLRFDASGGDLFVAFLLGALLTPITMGIYTPWFMCSLQKLIYSHTSLISGGQKVGDLDFVGTGGHLFVTFLVGYLLTLVTLGIYSFWFAIKLFKFYSNNTVATVNGTAYSADFTGTGGQYLVKSLLGYLLSMVTLGIYSFWFIADLLKWQTDNLPISTRR